MADIDMINYTGTDYKIVGRNETCSFTGVFDGNGHIISNFNYTCKSTDYVGLFGHVSDPNAQIKDFGLIDPNVDAGTGGCCVGPLVGYLRQGSVKDCFVQGDSVSGDTRN